MDGDVTVRVVFTDGLSHLYTGGKKEFEIQARNLRGVIKALDAQFPGLAEHLEEETTVAIDGEIHESGTYIQPVHEGSEVFFIPKLEGG